MQTKEMKKGKSGLEKIKEDESRKRKQDKMQETPSKKSLSSGEPSVAAKQNLVNKGKTVQEKTQKKRKHSSDKKNKSESPTSDGPSMSKSPERVKVHRSLPDKSKQRSSKAQNDDLKGKTRSVDEVTDSAEKYTQNTRRVKIMQALGLMAPAESPFCKKEYVSAPPRSPFIPMGRVSAPSRSPSCPKARVPVTERLVVCGLSAGTSGDHVMK